MDNKLINILGILIILDIISTLICIMVGGIEYNPISLFFITQSYLLFILIKIIMLLIIYILNTYTLVFKNKIMQIFIFIIDIIFLIVVLLNMLYIIIKISGMI